MGTGLGGEGHDARDGLIAIMNRERLPAPHAPEILTQMRAQIRDADSVHGVILASASQAVNLALMTGRAGTADHHGGPARVAGITTCLQTCTYGLGTVTWRA